MDTYYTINRTYDENEDYQSKNIDYLESPIYSLSDNDILDKFYANDYDIEDFLEDDGLEI